MDYKSKSENGHQLRTRMHQDNVDLTTGAPRNPSATVEMSSREKNPEKSFLTSKGDKRQTHLNLNLFVDTKER